MLQAARNTNTGGVLYRIRDRSLEENWREENGSYLSGPNWAAFCGILCGLPSQWNSHFQFEKKRTMSKLARLFL